MEILSFHILSEPLRHRCSFGSAKQPLDNIIEVRRNQEEEPRNMLFRKIAIHIYALKATYMHLADVFRNAAASGRQ